MVFTMRRFSLRVKVELNLHPLQARECSVSPRLLHGQFLLLEPPRIFLRLQVKRHPCCGLFTITYFAKKQADQLEGYMAGSKREGWLYQVGRRADLR